MPSLEDPGQLNLNKKATRVMLTGQIKSVSDILKNTIFYTVKKGALYFETT